MSEIKITPRVKPPSSPGRKLEPARSVGIEGGKRVGVLISKAQHKALKIKAVEDDTTVADVMRDAIDAYLKKGVKTAKPAPAAAEADADSGPTE